MMGELSTCFCSWAEQCLAHVQLNALRGHAGETSSTMPRKLEETRLGLWSISSILLLLARDEIPSPGGTRLGSLVQNRALPCLDVEASWYNRVRQAKGALMPSTPQVY